VSAKSVLFVIRKTALDVKIQLPAKRNVLLPVILTALKKRFQCRNVEKILAGFENFRACFFL